MSNTPYKPVPGDMEIRILSSGKVVMIVPDEALLEIGRAIEPGNYELTEATESKNNVRNRTNQTK